MKTLPKTRNENIVVQHLGSETLIYDLTSDKAYCLNQTLTYVYQACDNRTSPAELKKKYELSDDFIYLALDELKDKSLLAEDYNSPLAGLSRREAIRKVGLTSMIALPVIASIVAPTAAHAASNNVCSAPAPAPCIRRLNPVCANCSPGQQATFTLYNSGNGSCSGGILATNVTVTCSPTQIFNNDAQQI